MGTRSAQTRLGPYRLFERLAVGGVGELFLAESDAHPVCVVKRVRPDLAEDRRFLATFLEEARVAARLDHPGLTRIFDVGNEDGQCFIAMEYLPGEDGASLIAAATEKRKPLTWSLACSMAIAAADALHYAHEARGPDGAWLNLVHRDVRPSNLFVTYAGAVKVLDFGIGHSVRRFERTTPGNVKGKASYRAPEAAEGAKVDRRADLWSLGVCLRELLPAENVPSGVSEVVDKATAQRVDERFSTCAAFANALRAQLSPLPPQALATAMRERFGERRAQLVLARATPQPSDFDAAKTIVGSPADALDAEKTQPVVDAASLVPVEASSRGWWVVLALVLAASALWWWGMSRKPVPGQPPAVTAPSE